MVRELQAVSFSRTVIHQPLDLRNGIVSGAAREQDGKGKCPRIKTEEDRTLIMVHFLHPGSGLLCPCVGKNTLFLLLPPPPF